MDFRSELESTSEGTQSTLSAVLAEYGRFWAGQVLPVQVCFLRVIYLRLRQV